GLLVHCHAGCDSLEVLEALRFLGLGSAGRESSSNQALAPRRDPQQSDELRRRRELTRFLWGLRRPILGTPAETYLQWRACSAPLPAPLGYLPARDEYPHAMIAAFSIPSEPQPGLLRIDDNAVVGVHLTKLVPDGRGKLGDPAKIMLGRSIGMPIVL